MLHIVKLYKQLFTSLVESRFAAENYGPIIDKLNKGEELMHQRSKDLVKKFLESTPSFKDGISSDDASDNKALLEALIKFAQLKGKTAELTVEYFIETLKLKKETKREIAELRRTVTNELKEDVRVSQVDMSAVGPIAKGSADKAAVAQLQQFLVSLKLLSATEVGTNVGSYGNKTAAAVTAFQEKYNSAQPTKWKKSVTLSVSGNIDADTLTAIKDVQGNSVMGLVRHIKWEQAPAVVEGVPAKQDRKRKPRVEREYVSPDGHSDLWREVITDLKTIERYITAYNNTYGEKWNLLSNKMGILWILNQFVRESDSEALARELWISDRHLEHFAKNLWIKTGANVMPGIKRFAVITALSLVLTGWAGVAFELFGINISTRLHKGPNVNRILELLWREGNFTQKYRAMLLSKRTTIKDIEGVFDVLNNDGMIPATLRREIEELFDRHFLSDFFDLFGAWKDYRRAQRLISQFNKAQTVEQWEVILKELYRMWLKELREKRVRIVQLREEAASPSEHMNGNASLMLASNERTASKLEQSLAALWVEVSRIVDLRSKKDQISGKKFSDRKAQYMDETASIDAEIGAWRLLKKVWKEKLINGQAYSMPLPRPLSKSALSARINQMADSRIEGDQYSILANLMRWVKQHYGIDFSVQEFAKAFVNMKKLNEAQKQDFQSRMLSNTWRKTLQQFQWKIDNWEIAVMNINGTNVYLKDNCTNIVTVVNDVSITVEARGSIPVVAWFLIPGGGDTGTGSLPIDGGPIRIPPDVGGPLI